LVAVAVQVGGGELGLAALGLEGADAFPYE
jgi:hypothetical protein